MLNIERITLIYITKTHKVLTASDCHIVAYVKCFHCLWSSIILDVPVLAVMLNAIYKYVIWYSLLWIVEVDES